MATHGVVVSEPGNPLAAGRVPTPNVCVAGRRAGHTSPRLALVVTIEQNCSRRPPQINLVPELPVGSRISPERDPAAAGRLALAVQVLGAGTEPLARPLGDAGEIVATLRDHEFSDRDSRQLFEQLLKDLAAYGQPRGRGALRASALAEPEDPGRSLAMDIVRPDRYVPGAQLD